MRSFYSACCVNCSLLISTIHTYHVLMMTYKVLDDVNMTTNASYERTSVTVCM